MTVAGERTSSLPALTTPLRSGQLAHISHKPAGRTDQLIVKVVLAKVLL
jgi:hypothetical protein